MTSLPTSEAYSEIKTAFEHFNDRLFGGILEEPLFTLQRERRTYGYCSRQRFVQRSTGVLVDEIAMNPAYFAVRPIRATLSTLAHEMVHQWQFHHGKPGRGGYHNTEWANRMESIGLMPSNTGEPGGKRTGDRMTHYIIEGGAFDVACQELLTREFTLSWLDRDPAERPTSGAPVSLGGSPAGGVDDEIEDDTGGLSEGELEDVGLVVLPPTEPVNRTNRVRYA